MARLPQTRSEVFYSYVIQINGTPVGTLREFTPSQTRTHDYVREILTNGGEITEIVPGVPTYTITLNKVRLYENTILNHWGVISQDIQKQVRAIDIVETVWTPSDIPNEEATGSGFNSDGEGAIGRTLTYEDCWITDWGKTVSSDGILIIENMTAQCTRVT